jgi:uncharacterized protein YndB with AHSA1/START domain
MRANEEPIVVEQTFNVSPGEVWKSITEPELMRQWYFDKISSFKPEVGFETRFTVSNEGRNFPHRWRVTEVEPEKKLAYDWSYENYPGDAWVVFELFEEGSTTRLRVTHTTRKDFPQEIPEFHRDSGLAGWQYFVQKSLKEYLEGASNTAKGAKGAR